MPITYAVKFPRSKARNGDPGTDWKSSLTDSLYFLRKKVEYGEEEIAGKWSKWRAIFVITCCHEQRKLLYKSQDFRWTLAHVEFTGSAREILYSEEGKAGKYGRGDGKNEEEMKDQLALLRKLAKGVVWCSVYTQVCLRHMFVGSCAYMHSAFWSSSLFFYFIVIIIPAAPFSLFLSV